MGKQYDVAIIGTGIAGTVLGAILSRQGLSVIMLDQGTHPRFAVGESTVRETTAALKILGDRYDVPELKHMATYADYQQNISSNCGIKRHLGFVYHKEGQKQNPEHVFQSLFPDSPEGPEMHYFRQETDQYMLSVAVRYGADVRLATPIKDVKITKSGTTLTVGQGEIIEAQFIADASGFRSLLADKYELRENPSRLKTHTRSIFTHMINVKPYEQVNPASQEFVPRLWSQGTTHMLFDGGWLWLIPFNNGHKPTNPLVSVGLQLDPRRHPRKPGVTAEAEFHAFLKRFPEIANIFTDAKPVRDWVATDRLNFSSRRSAGYRWAMTAHAYGFIDPLYSRGLGATFFSIYMLLEDLLPAFKDMDFAEERFAGYEKFVSTALDNVDSLVNGSLVSWRDWDLTNAWLRVFYTSAILGFLHYNTIYKKYLLSGRDLGALKNIQSPHAGSFCPSLDCFQPWFEQAVKIIDAVDHGQMMSAEAVPALWAILRSNMVPPSMRIFNKNNKFSTEMTLMDQFEMAKWSQSGKAHKEVREMFFSGDPMDVVANTHKAYMTYTQLPKLNEIRGFLKATETPVRLPKEEIERHAERLIVARVDAKPVPLVTVAFENLNLEDAYRIQVEVAKKALGRGEKQTGLKLDGMSAKRRAYLKLDMAASGILTDTMKITEGAEHRSKFVMPKVEGEIAFVLSEDLKSPVTGEEVMAACAEVRLAIAMTDSRYVGEPRTVCDSIADNCSCGKYLLGDERLETKAVDFKMLKIDLRVDNKPHISGRASDIFDSFSDFSVQLAKVINSRELKLGKGFVILAGSAFPAVSVEEGRTYSVTANEFGSVSFEIAAEAPAMDSEPMIKVSKAPEASDVIKTMTEAIEKAMARSPEGKVLTFKLDGVDIQRALAAKGPNAGYADQQIQLIVNNPQYFKRTRWFKNDKELTEKEIQHIFGFHLAA